MTVANGRQDSSNWPAVRFAANQVIAVCAVGTYPFGTTGGYTTMGMNNDIRVAVRARSAGDQEVA